jgi:hypothetical protein
MIGCNLTASSDEEKVGKKNEKNDKKFFSRFAFFFWL